MIDAYFRGFFDSAEDDQETDTHFRCQDGKPDFEWRLVYKIGVPRKDYTFHLQCYDRDFFKSNEMVGEATIDLKQIIEDCTLVKKPLALNDKYYEEVMKKQNPGKNDNAPKFESGEPDKFWLKCMGKNKEGKIECTGSVRIQVNVLPLKVAESNKAAKGRADPNHSPTLPKPEGRLELSLNPFKMFAQLIGPALRRKIYCACCVIICCALCVMMAPMIISNLVASWL